MKVLKIHEIKLKLFRQPLGDSEKMYIQNKS